MEPSFKCLTIPAAKKDRWTKTLQQAVDWTTGFKAAGGETKIDVSTLDGILAAIEIAYETCPPGDKTKGHGQIVGTADQPCNEATFPEKQVARNIVGTEAFCVAIDDSGQAIITKLPDGRSAIVMASPMEKHLILFKGER